MPYKTILSIKLILILIFGLGNNCDSQTKQYLNQNEIRTVIDTCIHAFKTYYIYPDAVPKISEKQMGYILLILTESLVIFVVWDVYMTPQYEKDKKISSIESSILKQ